MPDGDGNLRGVVLKSYFDVGNQADSRSYDVVSLSVVSGTWDEWMPFEKDWNRVLAEHGADYVHTTDAVSRQGIFRVWTEKKVDSFLRSCVRAACKHCARYSRRNDRGKFGLLPFVASVVLKTSSSGPRQTDLRRRMRMRLVCVKPWVKSCYGRRTKQPASNATFSLTKESHITAISANFFRTRRR